VRHNLAIALTAVVAVFALFGIGYSVGSGKADARALAANRTADSLATVLDLQTQITDQVLEANRLVVAEVESLKERSAAPRARVRSVSVAQVPDTCKAIVETILADADTVFVADSSAIARLESQNDSLASRLSVTNGLLLDAKIELREQAKRTERKPRKILGLIPMPTVTVGAGGTYSGGRVHTGPSTTVGWSVKL
jgi:hypothetical protein